MKRKYFSRGLGLGILVTALLFAFGLIFYKPSLSDEEIKARATLLGMTETSDRRITSETSASSSASSAISSASSSEGTSSAASSAVPGTSAEPENTPTSAEKTPAASDEPEPSLPEPSREEPAPAEPAPVEPAQSEPSVPSEPAEPAIPAIPEIPEGNPTAGDELRSVTISPQETSLAVSQNLYRAGIISDPAGFNKFLEENGYDYNIQTGTYWISPNASYETIAHAITNI